jgi:MFS family permease
MTERSQYALLGERRFGPFFATQFLGALNEQALFILPFFLFSAQAGQLADKFERSRIIRLVKLAEIGIMLVAAAGFMYRSLHLLLGALFLMGVHSTVFGPVKYAILPQHLLDHELVGGNALVETGTFLAILLGTILGGVLVGVGGSHAAAAACIVIAIAGYIASRAVPHSPAPVPELPIDWNPLRETLRNLRFIASNRTVFNSVLGVSWFWFYGAMFLAQFPAYARDMLGGGEQVVTLLLAVFSLGIGVGSLLCERLSGHKVEIGLVPFGAIGMTMIAVDLFFASPVAAPASGLTALQFLGQAGSTRILLDLLLCRQQHSECGIRCRCRPGSNRLSQSGAQQRADLPGHRTGERGCRGLHLHAGAGIPDALHCLAAYSLGLPAGEVRAGAYSRQRSGSSRLQSRQLCRCAGNRRCLPAPGPVRDGPQHIPHPAAQFRVSDRAGDPDRARSRGSRTSGKSLR